MHQNRCKRFQISEKIVKLTGSDLCAGRQQFNRRNGFEGSAAASPQKMEMVFFTALY